MYTAGQPVSRHGRPQWHAARGPTLIKEISLTLLSARINPTPLLVVLVLRRLLPHRAATTPTSFLSSRKENCSLAFLSIMRRHRCRRGRAKHACRIAARKERSPTQGTNTRASFTHHRALAHPPPHWTLVCLLRKTASRWRRMPPKWFPPTPAAVGGSPAAPQWPLA